MRVIRHVKGVSDSHEPGVTAATFPNGGETRLVDMHFIRMSLATSPMWTISMCQYALHTTPGSSLSLTSTAAPPPLFVALYASPESVPAPGEVLSGRLDCLVNGGELEVLISDFKTWSVSDNSSECMISHLQCILNKNDGYFGVGLSLAGAI
jgi:hypothetical protein